MSNKDRYLKFIIENKNKLNNNEIAEVLGISDRYVSKIKREHGIPAKIEYTIDDVQNQIILSGILGDGNLKKNGMYNYYYRESHSVKEEEYLEWKFNKLKPLTEGCNITYIPARRETQNPQKIFNTKTLKELIPYSNMSKLDIIKELNELGLVLYILDDGWKHNHSKYSNKYNINLAVHGLSNPEKLLLIEKYKTVLNVECKIICKDENTISFGMIYNDVFIKVLKKYDLWNIDVSNKKF